MMDKFEDFTLIDDFHGRTTLLFNDGWRFKKLAQKNGLSKLTIEENSFDDTLWESVSLPHTFNDIDGADGWSGKDEGGEDYYRGLCGYRKSAFFKKSLYKDKSIFIEFEGANTVTTLYVNGNFVGVHEGGFSAFRFNITKFLKLDEENIFTVKISNAPTNYIAPITNQGDFTKMGGIYRDVKIIAVGLAHLNLLDYGATGVYVTLKNLTAEIADTNVLIKLSNDRLISCDVDVKAEILDLDGEVLYSQKCEVYLDKLEDKSVEFDFKISNPILWNGVENPYIYIARIAIQADGKTLDCFNQTFGIRTYSIDAKNGFFLNGRHLDLNGVNYHQDSYENGWAMTDHQRQRDYELMREMGCTSVRMAHYQHDDYEYQLCDRLGLTVWTEIGIVNKMSADDDTLVVDDRFFHNASQQLIELIRQNYNHPSIIVWGISNELYQMSDEIFEIYTKLHAIAKKEDNSRLTTFADAQFWGKFLQLPADVVGYNRYFGWYKDAGSVQKFGEWLDLYHNTKETRPICVSEFGGGGAISQFKDNINWETDIDPWGKRHYQNYQSQMFEKIWIQFSQRPYLWAKYIWCMFDFASDGREEGDTKGQNDKGLCTRERIPKDAFYFFKSVWNKEPMLHLTEKGFKVRNCNVPMVKAYSNADSVELFVNGISQGRIYSHELECLSSTIFIWENIKILKNCENEISVKAYLGEDLFLGDTAFWTGE